MAEITGLAMGTLALASLFSTSIDLLERFELGKNQVKDYHLACTKLYLLKIRLRSCRADVADWRLSTGSDAMERSLLGIKSLFQDAAILQDKYNLVPRKSITWSRLSISKSSPLKHQSPSPPHAGRFLRQRTTWAIRDKQKFDTLLQDLDFLVQSLETVIAWDTKSHRTSSMPHPNQPFNKSNTGSKMSTAEKPIAPQAHDNSLDRSNESKKPECGLYFNIDAVTTGHASCIYGPVGDSTGKTITYTIKAINEGHSTTIFGPVSPEVYIKHDSRRLDVQRSTGDKAAGAE